MADILVGLVKHKHITTEYKLPEKASEKRSPDLLRFISGILIGEAVGLFLQILFPSIQHKFAYYVNLIISIINSAVDFL